MLAALLSTSLSTPQLHVHRDTALTLSWLPQYAKAGTVCNAQGYCRSFAHFIYTVTTADAAAIVQARHIVQGPAPLPPSPSLRETASSSPIILTLIHPHRATGRLRLRCRWRLPVALGTWPAAVGLGARGHGQYP